MKISYRTHPIIQFIKKRSLGKIGVFQVDHNEETQELVYTFGDYWKKYCDDFGANIQVLTKPFQDALLSSVHKLAKKDIFMSTPSSSGTIFLDNTAYCYSYSNFGESDRMALYIFDLTKKDDPVIIGFYLTDVHPTDPSQEYTALWASKAVGGNDMAKYYDGHLMLILNFIKYAQIETKVVGAKSKVKDFNCKYVKDTDSDITILDSTWFTTLVKSEGFKVRGHFRLQPYGPSMKEKKLIWIKDFEKTGYTREAKRPLNDDELPTSEEQK